MPDLLMFNSGLDFLLSRLRKAGVGFTVTCSKGVTILVVFTLEASVFANELPCLLRSRRLVRFFLVCFVLAG